MSNSKLKPPGKNGGVILPWSRPRERSWTPIFIPWKTVAPRADEAVRWECTDGRWITIALAHDSEAGVALVRNSSGDCECADSFEAALAVAKKWRTTP